MKVKRNFKQKRTEGKVILAEDLIRKIKEAEEEARRIIHEAESKASELITEAEEKRKRRVEDARHTASRIVQEASERAGREAGEEIAELKEEGKARIEALCSGALRHMDRAVQCIVEGI